MKTQIKPYTNFRLRIARLHPLLGTVISSVAHASKQLSRSGENTHESNQVLECRVNENYDFSKHVKKIQLRFQICQISTMLFHKIIRQ